MQRSYNMIKELNKDFEITLVCLAQYSKIISYYGDFDEGLGDIIKGLSNVSSRLVMIRHGRLSRKYNKIYQAIKSLINGLPYDVSWLHSKELKHFLDSEVSCKRYDLIHFDTVGLWQYAVDLKPPVILNHHNIESEMLSRRAGNASGLIKKYLQLQAVKLLEYESSAASSANLNITCSSNDSEKLKARGINNTSVLENGVDLDYFTRKAAYPCGNSLRPSLIFVGGLEWYPNRQAMLYFSKEVWPLLSSSIEGISMTIIGRGTIKEIDDISIGDDNFNHLGFVDDVRPYIEQAMIYVCPIMDGGGTRLKVLDALAMGVPLVAHPIACEGIDVEDGVNVLFAETPEEYVQKIKELVNNPSLRSSLSKNGRKLIENNYSYSILGEKARQLYHSVMFHNQG